MIPYLFEEHFQDLNKLLLLIFVHNLCKYVKIVSGFEYLHRGT